MPDKKNRFLQNFSVAFCVLATLSMMFPFMSGYALGDFGLQTIRIRGYTFALFSGYGFLMFLAPWVLLIVSSGSMKARQKAIASATVCIGYAVCLILSIAAGRQWLLSLNARMPVANITKNIGLWYSPLMFAFEAITVFLDIVVCDTHIFEFCAEDVESLSTHS